MPVALDPGDPGALGAWLSAAVPGAGSHAGRDDISRLLAPAREDLLVATPVSRHVNSVKHDDPGCLAPPGGEPPPAQTTLF
jgi:hypothetical protein